MTEKFKNVNQHLDELTGDIIEVEPQPTQWSGWMVRLLERLEIAAAGVDGGNLDRYEEMLEILQDAINERLESGRW